MPIFDVFDGIAIHVFPREHLPPHCHVWYAEYEALINIRTLDVFVGWLPAKQLKKAIAYISVAENQQDLLETFYTLNPHIKRI
ncbi:MAG: DUF4160 domain-containing protein [Cytophagales bacterium]|nr:MAG: DUF4160 domain-containing protein [Cytophagales bacterium]